MHTSGKFLLTLALISISLASHAQGSNSGRHTLGGFAGFTDRFDTDFTFGGEYEYRLQGPWSVGSVLEYTPNVILGDDFTTLLGTVNYRPPSIPRMKFTGGAGVEFKDVGGDDLRFRFGAGYDVFQGPITITPRVGVDVGDGDESVVLGVTASHRF